jgi:hypothetical protein
VNNETMMYDRTYGSESRHENVSWQDREIRLSLHRLANARAHLATLEERAAPPTNRLTEAEPADVVELQAIGRELERLRPKAHGRFGGSSAREKVVQLELRQWIVLERIGFSTYDEYVAACVQPIDTTPAVDEVVLDFARREFRSAEQAFLEVAAIVMPEAEPDSGENLASGYEDEDYEDEYLRFKANPAAS